MRGVRITGWIKVTVFSLLLFYSIFISFKLQLISALHSLCVSMKCANRDCAKELMQQNMLREIAIVLSQKVSENASTDWIIAKVDVQLQPIINRHWSKQDI